MHSPRPWPWQDHQRRRPHTDRASQRRVCVAGRCVSRAGLRARQAARALSNGAAPDSPGRRAVFFGFVRVRGRRFAVVVRRWPSFRCRAGSRRQMSALISERAEAALLSLRVSLSSLTALLSWLTGPLSSVDGTVVVVDGTVVVVDGTVVVGGTVVVVVGGGVVELVVDGASGDVVGSAAVPCAAMSASIGSVSRVPKTRPSCVTYRATKSEVLSRTGSVPPPPYTTTPMMTATTAALQSRDNSAPWTHRA